ncbi:MAG: transporter substrate-binding domain-containing protein [Elusimicrobiaceae bacterium]|nr:transporter substrate-binding domain-containing protein [Elusimicrobiaceae bacterium]
MNRIMAFALAVISLSGCAAPGKMSAATASVAKPIRVGVYQNKPAVFILPDGSVGGLSIAPLIAAAKANNWNLQFEECYWAQCLMLLETGGMDLMVDIAYTPERAKLYDFSHEPVFLTWGQLYQKPGAGLDTLAALKGKTVAALANDVHNIGPDGIRKMLADAGVNCEIAETESYLDAFSAAASGKADAAMVPSMWGAENARTFGLEPAGIRTGSKEIRYAARKGTDPAILTAIDKILKTNSTTARGNPQNDR